MIRIIEKTRDFSHFMHVATSWNVNINTHSLLNDEAR